MNQKLPGLRRAHNCALGMTLEKALAYIEDDELVEVTPKSIRLCRKLLDPNDRSAP